MKVEAHHLRREFFMSAKNLTDQELHQELERAYKERDLATKYPDLGSAHSSSYRSDAEKRVDELRDEKGRREKDG